MEQLKTMAPSPVSPTPPPSFAAVPPPPTIVIPPAPNLPPFPPNLLRDHYQAPPRPPQMTVVPTQPPIPSTRILHPSTPMSSDLPPAQATPSFLSGIPVNVADILRSLNTSGIMSTPRTPDSQPVKLAPKSVFEEYEDMIISMAIRLESLDTNQ